MLVQLPAVVQILAVVAGTILTGNVVVPETAKPARGITPVIPAKVFKSELALQTPGEKKFNCAGGFKKTFGN